MFQKQEQNRRRDVVREIRGHLPFAVPPRQEERRQIAPEDVGRNYFHIVVAANSLCRKGTSCRSTSTARTRAPCSARSLVSAPLPGPTSSILASGASFDQVGDTGKDVPVGQEVLTQGFLRPGLFAVRLLTSHFSPALLPAFPPSRPAARPAGHRTQSRYRCRFRGKNRQEPRSWRRCRSRAGETGYEAPARAPGQAVSISPRKPLLQATPPATTNLLIPVASTRAAVLRPGHRRQHPGRRRTGL